MFVVIFTIEALIKILGMGWILYQRNNWNKFDFAIVIISLVSLQADTGVGASVFRLLRIARVFRLIKKAKNLHKLFQTLLLSS